MISRSTIGFSALTVLPQPGDVPVGVRLRPRRSLGPPLCGDPLVEAEVVEPAEAQGRTVHPRLGRVVVDDVEEHLDAGRVEVLHHLLELAHLLAAVARGGVRRVRGEEPDRVVAPVVRQPVLREGRLGGELLGGQQLHRGDAEVAEIVGDHPVAEAGVRPAELLGDPVVQRGEALHVQLVDRGVAPPGADLAVGAPVEVVVHDHAAGNVRRRVALVPGVRGGRRAEVIPGLEAEDRRVGAEVPTHRAGVGIEEELGRLKRSPWSGSHGPSARNPYRCPGSYAGHRAVPDPEALLGQRVAGLDGRRRRGTPTRRWRSVRAPRSWSTPRSTWPPAASCGRARRRRARRRSTTLPESPGDDVTPGVNVRRTSDTAEVG